MLVSLFGNASSSSYFFSSLMSLAYLSSCPVISRTFYAGIAYFVFIFINRIEIQYKHLLTLWRNRHWHLKQSLSASGAFSGVQVVHTVAGEKVSHLIGFYFQSPNQKFECY